MNRLATLSAEERAAGVVAASAGNHGQAVAWAAREVGVHATIFMPQDAPMAKVEPTVGYGAEEVLVGAGFEEALAAAMERVEETGATFVHAFEDERVIAGQGTIGLQLAEQVRDVETVLIPVGGGGLAAGISIALRALRPKVRLGGGAGLRGGPTLAASDAAQPAGGRGGWRGGSARGQVRRQRTGLRDALGRQQRPDAPDLGDAPWSHRRGPLPRAAQPPPRSTGRADPLPRGRRGPAGQHRRDRAPA